MKYAIPGGITIAQQGELARFENTIRQTYGAAQGALSAEDFEGAFFIGGGEAFFEMAPDSPQEDHGCFAVGNFVCRQKCGETGYAFVAEQSGFLGLDENRCLHIISPYVVSEDRMQLFLLVLPLQYGKETFIDKAVRSIFINDSGFAKTLVPEISEQVIISKLDSRNPTKLLIRQGWLPQPGRDAQVSFKFDRSPPLVEDEKGRIQFQEVRKYLEVEKGVVIAEKVPVVPARQGYDVLGNILPVEAPKDSMFTAGGNIETVSDGQVIQYRALESGLLILSDHSAQVLTTLHVHGDTTLESGNLRFSRDIVVEGAVRSGFKVDCGGNLTIKECVEDRVNIQCQGNLIISEGAYGEATVISVGGDAQIGFVQDCTLRVRGDLTIRDYTYNANMRCRGTITVTGNGVATRGKGCAVGGYLVGLRGIELHSAGFHTSSTTLCAGADPDLIEKLKETSKMAKVLELQAATLQRSLGIDLSKPDLAERLKALSPSIREHILKKIQKLRDLLRTIARSKEDLEKLQIWAAAPNELNTTIRISHQAQPELLFIIRGIRSRLMEERRKIMVLQDIDRLKIVPWA